MDAIMESSNIFECCWDIEKRKEWSEWPDWNHWRYCISFDLSCLTFKVLTSIPNWMLFGDHHFVIHLPTFQYWTTTTNSSACYNSNSSVFVFFSFVIIIQNIPSIRRDDFFLNNSSYFNIHLFYTFVFQCNLRPVCATAIQSLFLTAGPTRSQTTTNISSVALRVVCRISWIMSFHLRFISWITLEQ